MRNQVVAEVREPADGGKVRRDDRRRHWDGRAVDRLTGKIAEQVDRRARRAWKHGRSTLARSRTFHAGQTHRANRKNYDSSEVIYKEMELLGKNSCVC